MNLIVMLALRSLGDVRKGELGIKVKLRHEDGRQYFVL
jgi:hypothetical protein